MIAPTWGFNLLGAENQGNHGGIAPTWGFNLLGAKNRGNHGGIAPTWGFRNNDCPYLGV